MKAVIRIILSKTNGGNLTFYTILSKELLLSRQQNKQKGCGRNLGGSGDSWASKCWAATQVYSLPHIMVGFTQFVLGPIITCGSGGVWAPCGGAPRALNNFFLVSLKIPSLHSIFGLSIIALDFLKTLLRLHSRSTLVCEHQLLCDLWVFWLNKSLVLFCLYSIFF